MDSENEGKLKAAFDALTQNKTVIMIAHRLETIKNADKIAVISGSKIESGTHEKLMVSNPIYSRFVHMREQASDWKMG